jgi:hypothetical protein
VITIPVIWCLFVLAVLLAPSSASPSLLFKRDGQYLSLYTRSLDRTAATFFGFDGHKTISQECGDCEDCKLSKFLCPILDITLQKNHCEISK